MSTEPLRLPPPVQTYPCQACSREFTHVAGLLYHTCIPRPSEESP